MEKNDLFLQLTIVFTIPNERDTGRLNFTDKIPDNIYTE